LIHDQDDGFESMELRKMLQEPGHVLFRSYCLVKETEV
jgi:hypothetical protein